MLVCTSWPAELKLSLWIFVWLKDGAKATQRPDIPQGSAPVPCLPPLTCSYCVLLATAILVPGGPPAVGVPIVSVGLNFCQPSASGHLAAG